MRQAERREGGVAEGETPVTMALRRIPLLAPLAVLVALLAHTARFGSSHAFGGQYGANLIAAALAATALLLLIAPVAMGFERSPARREAPFLAALKLALGLGVGGAAVYAGMEWLEGHGPGLASWADAALGISALLVALLAVVAKAGLRRVARAIAAALGELATRGDLEIARTRSEIICHNELRPRERRGRAPPVFA